MGVSTLKQEIVVCDYAALTCGTITHNPPNAKYTPYADKYVQRRFIRENEGLINQPTLLFVVKNTKLFNVDPKFDKLISCPGNSRAKARASRLY